MAVSLPSDLIADVMRNANPTRVDSATARLHGLGTAPPSEEFRNILGEFSEALSSDVSGVKRSDGPVSVSRPPLSSGFHDGRTDSQVQAAFERMVLRNLFESLIPEAGTGVFGTGPSAEVWRSLAVDQLAGVYADSGGLGIATSLKDEDPGINGNVRAQWPYFSVDRIEAFSG